MSVQHRAGHRPGSRRPGAAARLPVLLVGLCLVLALAGAGAAQGKEEGAGLLAGLFARKHGVEPVRDPLYRESCGECHFAYQPGWLPAASWRRLLRPEALEDHFGDVADLEEEERRKLLAYLERHAADRSSYRLSKKVMHSLRPGEVPLRITELRYFRRKHAEIPRRYVQDNPKVGALSQCDRCHTHAEEGRFDEDQVVIPGVGRWIDVD